MPYPRRFLRLVASGTMLGGREIWSCSLNFGIIGTENLSEVESFCSAAVGSWTDFLGNAASLTSTTTDLRLVKANVIGTDGLYLSDQTTVFEDVDPPVRGASTAQRLPPQATVAISLLTRKQRGLASRGRFYPPTSTATISETGAIDPQQVDRLVSQSLALVNALNAIQPERFYCAVVSDTRSGAIAAVTRVSVGNVVDTQRRRRNALREEYVTADVARDFGGAGGGGPFDVEG